MPKIASPTPTVGVDASIPTRTIPALGRDVSALGLGCMGISWAYASADTASDHAGSEVLACPHETTSAAIALA